MAVDLAEQSSGSHADLLSPADNSESAPQQATFRFSQSPPIEFACPGGEEPRCSSCITSTDLTSKTTVGSLLIDTETSLVAQD